MPSSEEIIFSAPSKTFLVGEYCVLNKGPSLLLATTPRFRLSARRVESAEMPFHPDSPAGLYYTHKELQHWHIEFSDPHLGQGGFGASSSQLLLLMALRENFGHDTFEKSKSLLEEYLSLVAQSGASSSGADFVTQLKGGIVFYQPDPFVAQNLEWGLADLDFALIRTGFKLATHEHVQTLKSFATQDAEALVLKAKAALENNNTQELLEAVREYRSWLRRLGFEAAHTTELLNKIESTGLVSALKGCGAMGADVVLVLFSPAKREQLLSWARTAKLAVTATGRDLSAGLTREA